MSSSVSLLSFLAILGYVSSQGLFEEHHMHTISSIPSEFVIPDINPAKEFEKYANQIHHLAKRDNVTILYKIKVDILKKLKMRNYSKKFLKKMKPKKYNVPLKKNSMKLSNFEQFLRKTAEETNHNPQNTGALNYQQVSSTEQPPWTTKILHLKYKPIVSKLSNFSKIIKPVKNRIITLS